MAEINIEKIMEEIRSEIKEKGYDASVLSFDDLKYDLKTDDEKFDCDFFLEHINFINHNYQVETERPLTGNTIFVFIKRVIRKLTRFYIRPAVDSQNQFNVCIVRTLNCVKDYIQENEDLKNRYSEASQIIEALELRQRHMENEIEELKRKIEGISL